MTSQLKNIRDHKPHRGGGEGKYTKISGEVGFCNLTLHLNVSFLGAKKIETKWKCILYFSLPDQRKHTTSAKDTKLFTGLKPSSSQSDFLNYWMSSS